MLTYCALPAAASAWPPVALQFISRQLMSVPSVAAKSYPVGFLLLCLTTEGGGQQLKMPCLLCLLFHDALSHHAYVFLLVSVNLEADLSTQEEMPTSEEMPPHEEMPTQSRMATQEEKATQDDTAEL